MPDNCPFDKPATTAGKYDLPRPLPNKGARLCRHGAPTCMDRIGVTAVAMLRSARWPRLSRLETDCGSFWRRSEVLTASFLGFRSRCGLDSSGVVVTARGSLPTSLGAGCPSAVYHCCMLTACGGRPPSGGTYCERTTKVHERGQPACIGATDCMQPLQARKCPERQPGVQ